MRYLDPRGSDNALGLALTRGKNCSVGHTCNYYNSTKYGKGHGRLFTRPRKD